MRPQEYGQTPQKRKAYVHQPALLLVGVDVSQAQQSAGMGTPTTMSCRTRAFTHTREGFKRFAQTLKAHLVNNETRRILITMAPSGLSWQALDERLKRCGYAVGLGHCPAVRNHRTTMQDGELYSKVVDEG